MTHVIERLLNKTVDLAVSAVPTTVRSDNGQDRQVVAAAFLVPSKIELPVHLVVYNRGDDELIAPDDKHWAVAVHYDNRTMGVKYTAHGDYDMTFAEAMAVFAKRVERQG